MFPDLPSNRYAEMSVPIRARCENYELPGVLLRTTVDNAPETGSGRGQRIADVAARRARGGGGRSSPPDRQDRPRAHHRPAGIAVFKVAYARWVHTGSADLPGTIRDPFGVLRAVTGT